jgi:hypothetical protein
MQVTTRKGMLGRLGVAIGGALGAGYAVSRALPDAATTVKPAGARQEALVVHGRNWRVGGTARAPGVRPGADEAAVPSGTIVDETGAELGSFRAAALPGPAASFQLHTFELGGGTLLGVGGGALREAIYAVVGGTGRYAGVSGSYVARQFPREAGGDGTAEFMFTLTIPEA